MNSKTSEKPSAPSDHSEVDPEIVRQAIRVRAEGIKRREVERAFNRLEAYGTLTTEQRQIITQMATTITDEILTAPESMLANASEYDPETVRIAIELFDPDGKRWE